MLRSFGLAALAAAFIAGIAHAQPAPAMDAGSRLPQGEAFLASMDNDSFDLFKNRPFSDRYYTHGTHLSLLARSRPEWVARVGDRLFPRADEIRVSLSLVQDIYTPRVLDLVDPSPEDRPYAGLLYAGAALLAASDRSLDTLEVRIGVVGPSSLGGFAQDTRHDAIPIARALGWDHQIEDEVVASVAYEHRAAPTVVWETRRGPLPRVERSHFVAGELGTMRTSLGAGGAFAARWGSDRDYGPLRNWPGPTVGAFGRASPRLLDATLFVGADLKAVLRDVTLDGNLLRDSARVDRPWVVGELQAGFSVRVWRLRASWARVVRTPEFAGQGGEFQEFERWSLTVTPFDDGRP